MAIPNVIHHVWVGGPLPANLKPLVDSWRSLHPDWGHALWGDDDLDWLANRSLFDDAESYVPAHAVGQFKADIARYEILHTLGGVYVDCDFECLHPIDGLLDAHAFATASVAGNGWVANGLLGMPPRHDLMARCIDALPGSAEANRGYSAARVSGPRFFTPLIRDKDRVTVYPAEWFYPYAWTELDQPYDPSGCYAVHHWHHRRTMRAQPIGG